MVSQCSLQVVHGALWHSRTKLVDVGPLLRLFDSRRRSEGGALVVRQLRMEGLRDYALVVRFSVLTRQASGLQLQSTFAAIIFDLNMVNRAFARRRLFRCSTDIVQIRRRVIHPLRSIEWIGALCTLWGR